MGQPTVSPTSVAPPTERVIGFDVARSLAILGMIVVHFSLVGAADRTRPAWLASVLALLDGRASAVFIILAGIGITLMSRKAASSSDSRALWGVRRTLFLRGLFLLLLGYINLTIWSGDILRIYGVSLLFAAVVVTWPDRALLWLAGAFEFVFVVFLLLGDFDRNWDWNTLTYHNLWTPDGIWRNLFFDGFRSVFPWTGMLLYGVWLGRLNLVDTRTNRRVIIAAVGSLIGAEIVSKALVYWSTHSGQASWDVPTARFFFGTESMPALPLFLLSAGGLATAVIALFVRLTTKYPGRLWSPFVATGQMALTWYCGHIVIGLGTLVAFDRGNTESLPVAAALGVSFFLLAVITSLIWKSIVRHGPLEWIMRRIAG